MDPILVISESLDLVVIGSSGSGAYKVSFYRLDGTFIKEEVSPNGASKNFGETLAICEANGNVFVGANLEDIFLSTGGMVYLY